jgi:hydrogenase nickel insertion protein HypA
MHEYALIKEIIEAILARTAHEDLPGAVAEVMLKIGVFEVHSESAARQAFQVLTKGTPLEASRLDLEIIPATCECPACGYAAPFLVDHHHIHDPLPVVECPRCGALANLSGGRGVEAIDLVLADSKKPE